MAGDNPELGIEITGRSDGAVQATQQVTSSVNEMGRAADNAQGATERLGGHGSSAFGKLVQGGRAAHGAMMGVNTAMQGGAATAVGLSRALNDVFMVMTTASAATGPIALTALGIGILLGVLRGLQSHASQTKTRLDELAASAGKLGAAWATKELKAFDNELRETAQQIELIEAKTKQLIATQEKLQKERTRQQVLTLQISEAEKEGKLARDIQAVESDRFLPQEVKDQRIAALRRANEDDKIRNRARIKQIEFTGEEEAAKLRLKSIDAEEIAAKQKAQSEKVHADEIASTVSARQAELLATTGQAQQLGTADQLRAQIANLTQSAIFAGARETPEAAKRAQAYLDQIPKLQAQLADITKQGLPSRDQLVSKLADLISEISKLNQKLETASEKAKLAGQEAASKVDLLEAEKTGIGAVLQAQGVTASLGVKLEAVQFDTSKIGELGRLQEEVRKNQETLYVLTGDAFNAQQMVLNRSVDIYQQVVRDSHVTDKQLQQIQRQMANARSVSSGNN